MDSFLQDDRSQGVYKIKLFGLHKHQRFFFFYREIRNGTLYSWIKPNRLLVSQVWVRRLLSNLCLKSMHYLSQGILWKGSAFIHRMQSEVCAAFMKYEVFLLSLILNVLFLFQYLKRLVATALKEKLMSGT